jgi:hypothetical protein
MLTASFVFVADNEIPDYHEGLYIRLLAEYGGLLDFNYNRNPKYCAVSFASGGSSAIPIVYMGEGFWLEFDPNGADYVGVPIKVDCKFWLLPAPMPA